MFSKPYQEKEGPLPSLPLHHKDFQAILDSVTTWSAADLSNPITYLKDYVLDHWLLPDDLRQVLGSSLAYDHVPEHKLFEAIGMINEIVPQHSSYDHILIDGGVKPILDYRLQYLTSLTHHGVKSKYITIFGGQKLRMHDDNIGGTLEKQAQSLHTASNSWARRWLDQELAKNPTHPNKWQRPFATEHEVSLLALIEWGGGKLRHIRTGYRDSPYSIHRSIPPASIAYEEFRLGNKTIRVLNALAIRRKFIERQLPLKESRPTGGSCFREWLSYIQPPKSASILLITHNPDIYRSWLDIMIVAHQSGRNDLKIEGAGDAILPATLYGEVLQSFGRLLINFYMIHQIETSKHAKA